LHYITKEKAKKKKICDTDIYFAYVHKALTQYLFKAHNLEQIAV